MNQEKIIDKIKKILNMTMEKGCTEAEAATAAVQAQALLFKYNLSMVEVEATADPSEEKTKVIREWDTVKSNKNYGKWKVTLLDRIARYNFCHIILSYGDSAMIIGQAHNIAVVKELYLWIAEQILKFSSEACKEYKGCDRVPTFRRSFLEAAANTVGNRLYRQWIKSQEESEKSTALVVNHEAMVQNYIQGQFPSLRTGRISQSSGSHDGLKSGKEAGERINLTSNKRLS